MKQVPVWSVHTRSKTNLFNHAHPISHRLIMCLNLPILYVLYYTLYSDILSIPTCMSDLTGFINWMK